MDILAYSITPLSSQCLEISIGIQHAYDMTWDLTAALQAIEDETDETSAETKARNVERLATAKAQIMYMNGRGQKHVRYGAPSIRLTFYLTSWGGYSLNRAVGFYMTTSVLKILTAINTALENVEDDLGALMSWLKKKKAIELAEIPAHLRISPHLPAFVEALSWERFNLSSRLKDADLAA